MADNRTWAQKQEDAAVKMQEARALQYPQLGAVAKDYASLPGRAIAGATDTAVVRPLRAMGLDVPYTPRSYYGPQGDASQMFPYMAQYAADLPANTAAAAERLDAYQQKVAAERAPAPPAQAATPTQTAISEPPAAVPAQASATRGAVPPGFITEMRGLQTSYYNPETQVRAPTTAAAEVLSLPPPKTLEEQLQRQAAVSTDPRPYLTALSQMDTTRARQSMQEASLLSRGLLAQLSKIEGQLFPPGGVSTLSKEDKARKLEERAALMQAFGALHFPSNTQNYAEGGKVAMQDAPDMPMAIDPTMAGKAAGMESGDYVFPVEAVQFYGLKMLKDMVKKAMTAE